MMGGITRIPLFILLLFVSPVWNAAAGQSTDNQARIDSLEATLEEHKALDEEKVDILNQLGYEFWIIDPAKSEEYGSEALEIARVLSYEEGKAFALRVIGVAHWVRGNADLAFKFLLQAEEIYESLADSLGLANSRLNLGMVYADQHNSASASQKYRQALAIFTALGEDSRIATTYTKMADLLIRENSYSEAYDYLARALEIHKANGFLYGIAEANSKLGKAAIAREAYTEAISYLLLAVEAARQRNDHVGLADYYQSIGLCYYRKKDAEQALAYLEKSQTLAEQYGLKKILREIYHTFKNLEASRGNYRAAIAYYDKYLEVKDELFNEEKSNIIANMEARRAFEEKERQLQLTQQNLALLEQRNRASRLTRLALILGLLALAAIGWGLLQRKNRKLLQKQKALKLAEVKTQKLEDTIRSKEQELTAYTLNFVHKNELMAELRESIEKLKSGMDKRKRAELDTLARKLDAALRVDEDWEDFRRHFESVHPRLAGRLNRDYPGLTQNEFRLIALLRLNLSSKEISSVLGISPDSVKTARYRLRKKLGLDSQEDLFEFLIAYEQAPE